MTLGIASFAGITIIAYLIGFIWKTSDTLPDKWIPCICGTVGCILGVIAYFIKVPDFPASDAINAAAVGIISGLAATGANQIKKQLYSSDKEDDEISTQGNDELEEVSTENTSESDSL